MKRSYQVVIVGCLTVFGLWSASSRAAHAGQPECVSQPDQPSQTNKARCVVVECFVDSQQPDQLDQQRSLEQWAQQHGGIRLAVRKIDSDQRHKERLQKLANHFQFDMSDTPVVYACNRALYSDGADKRPWNVRLEEALTIEVFTRLGCSRCANAKEFFNSFQQEYPALKVQYFSIDSSSHVRQRLNQLVTKHKQAAASVPVIHIADQLVIGFDSAATTGARLEKIMQRWSVACAEEKQSDTGSKSNDQVNLKDPKSASELLFVSRLVPEVTNLHPF